MDLNEKFFYLTGEVVKRIHNPEQKNETNGNVYRINYLVLKWVTGRDYVDYIPIKVFTAKSMADIRAGYIVRVPVRYSCTLGKDKTEVECRVVSRKGVNLEMPNLYPDFVLNNKQEIEIINSDTNYEANDEDNKPFNTEVIDTVPEPDDDLPF